MQKKSTGQSAFFNLRTLIGLLLCTVTACFILIPTRSGLAFLHPQAPSNALFGLLGVFLAVPAAALVQIVIDEFYLQPRKPNYAALDREAAALVEGKKERR
jgi:hypothetical protein